MKEFVFGTAEQFDALDRELTLGKYYKFPDRHLPETCTPDVACIWFGKVNEAYFLYIDKGITTTSEDEAFRTFLECGEKKFGSIDELADFMHSFKPLFEPSFETCLDDSCRKDDATDYIRSDVDNALPSNNQANNSTATEEPVVNKDKVREIKAEKEKVKTVWPEDLAAPLKKKVYGQDDVIDSLVDKVVINQMRKNKRLLTIALVGPTATGKSETAKSLAEVMTTAYETQYGYIEIAGSEFIGEHTVHRFFGSPPGYVGHGQPTILEPVRKNPHHVIVINEIEKADEKILVGLMEAIDTGMLGMADNSKPIDLNQCILLFTSNIPIDMDQYANASMFERAEMCRDAFTKHCGRPEISGKIGNFLVFSPLGDDATIDIIVKFVREELDSYDLKLISIDDHLMADFLKHQTKYGARGIRGLVSDSVGRHLLRTRKLDEFKDKSVVMKGTIDDIDFEVV